MKIIGFNYSKVSAERAMKWEPSKKINANIQFTEVQKDENEALKNVNVIRVSFSFDVTYEPKNASISLHGVVFVSLESEKAKEIMKQWTKKKDLSEEMRNLLVKFLWKKCNLKAFQLEEELNIPTHLQLPQISIRPQS